MLSRINRRRVGIVVIIGVLLLIVLGLVVGPVLFRQLLPLQIQASIARRIPMFTAWLPTDTPAPTREYTADSLPTSDPGRAAAALAQLEQTGTPVSVSPTAIFTETALSSLTPTQTEPATETPSPTSAATLLATDVLAATATDGPTLSLPPTNTRAPSRTPAPTIASTPLPATFRLDSYEWIPQTWNNCGPANLAQILNFYGMNTTQKETASWLKPTVNDVNVSPWQIVTYVHKFTALRAVQRYNGDTMLLKRLIAAHFGVMIETGLLLPKEAWMGHYLTVIGYSDGQSIFYGLDSFLGTGSDHLGMPEKYAELDKYWQHFNRVYIVVYPPEREAELSAILGPDADVTTNVERALDKARSEAQANPTNPCAWFNMGTNYVLLGQYQNAAKAYDVARNAGDGLPYRMLWYQFGPFAAYFESGDYDTTLKLIAATFGTTSNVEELWFWRGMVRAAQGDKQQAAKDFDSAVRYNPNYQPAVDALARLQSGAVPQVPQIP